MLGLLWYLLGNADFVILLKAQITRKKINLPKLFFVYKVRADTSNSLQYLIWLNSKTVKIYSVVQSVKFLLALSIFKPKMIIFIENQINCKEAHNLKNIIEVVLCK